MIGDNHVEFGEKFIGSACRVDLLTLLYSWFRFGFTSIFYICNNDYCNSNGYKNLILTGNFMRRNAWICSCYVICTSIYFIIYNWWINGVGVVKFFYWFGTSWYVRFRWFLVLLFTLYWPIRSLFVDNISLFS